MLLQQFLYPFVNDAQDSRIAVSYTHLDVYKRQERMMDAAFSSIEGLTGNKLWSEAGTVSYTHLDVYKRQGQRLRTKRPASDAHDGRVPV